MNILFFAKYAKNIDKIPQEEAVYFNYHQDVLKVLKSTGHNIIPCNNFDDLLTIENIDFIFTLFNKADFRCSEIFASEYAEYRKIPYLGARPNIRSLSEDKCLAKMLAEHLNIRTPQWVKLDCKQNFDEETISFEPPYFIKPRFGGSSKFISKNSIAYSFHDLKKQVLYLYENNNDVIIEEYIEGETYTVPLILNSDLTPNVLPPVLESSNCIVSTYLQKRHIEKGLKREISNDVGINHMLEQCVLEIYKFIAPIDYARFDFVVKDRKPYFIEFNIGCNLGKKAAIALSAANRGFVYDTLIKQILDCSIKRQISFY